MLIVDSRLLSVYSKLPMSNFLTFFSINEQNTSLVCWFILGPCITKIDFSSFYWPGPVSRSQTFTLRHHSYPSEDLHSWKVQMDGFTKYLTQVTRCGNATGDGIVRFIQNVSIGRSNVLWQQIFNFSPNLTSFVLWLYIYIMFLSIAHFCLTKIKFNSNNCFVVLESTKQQLNISKQQSIKWQYKVRTAHNYLNIHASFLDNLQKHPPDLQLGVKICLWKWTSTIDCDCLLNANICKFRIPLRAARNERSSQYCILSEYSGT